MKRTVTAKSALALVHDQAIPTFMEVSAALHPVLRRSDRFQRVMNGVVMAQAAYAGYEVLLKRFKKPVDYWTVAVREHDDLYEAAVALLGSQDEKNWKAVEATSIYDGDDNRKVEPVPANREERHLLIDGHKVFGYIDGMMPAPGGGVKILKSPSVVFMSKTEDGQKATLAALGEFYAAERAKETTQTPKLWSFDAWGWEGKGDLLRRPVESVAVAEGQVQAIIDDLKEFLTLEGEYTRRGIPFHRGYMLYGPPGTGKTSAVKAVASALGINLSYASLSTVNNDSDLNRIAQGMRGSSILLLEDIDAFGAARIRDEDEGAAETGSNAGMSTTGLLNILDGVDTPHGMITFVTTNHREFLDPALLRPGRIDRQFYFGNPDDATVTRHFTYFFDRAPSVPLYAGGRSGAEINEIFVSHMHDAEGAEAILAVLPTEPAFETDTENKTEETAA